MQAMGLETLYPKPNTSVPNKAHTIYPYLLNDMKIERPNQVFAADITYLPLGKKHAYLFAIMDWFSPYVLGWCVSDSLQADAYIEILKEVLAQHPCQLFNTDQGSQLTSNQWIKRLGLAWMGKVAISITSLLNNDSEPSNKHVFI